MDTRSPFWSRAPALLVLGLLLAPALQAQHVRTLSVEPVAMAEPGALALSGRAALVPEAASGAFRVYGTATLLLAGEAPVTASAPAEAPEAQAGPALPTAFALAPGYPNPFSGRATLRYALPVDASVRIVVFDVLGREVARLIDAELPAGWHEAALDGSSLSAGTYLVRLEATGGEAPFSQTQRLTVLR